MIRIALLCALALCVLAPDSATACAVCYGGAEESRKAFLLTTAILSLLPLAMFGSIFWWFRRRFREMDRVQLPVGIGIEHEPRTARLD